MVLQKLKTKISGSDFGNWQAGKELLNAVEKNALCNVVAKHLVTLAVMK